jgi:hypothetical protein
VLRDRDSRKLSISKYRTGIDALLARDETGDLDKARALFGDS